MPTVAFPHLPSNTRPVAEARDVKIDQAVIGSCTNGRLDDMRQAAAVLKGRKVHPDVRCIVIPATQQVYRQCMEEGLMDIFFGCQLCRFHSHLRAVFGRLYGHFGRWRARHCHHQPKLRGPHGRSHC